MDESLKDLNDFLLSNNSEDIISSSIEYDHLSIDEKTIQIERWSCSILDEIMSSE